MRAVVEFFKRYWYIAVGLLGILYVAFIKRSNLSEALDLVKDARESHKKESEALNKIDESLNNDLTTISDNERSALINEMKRHNDSMIEIDAQEKERSDELAKKELDTIADELRKRFDKTNRS